MKTKLFVLLFGSSVLFAQTDDFATLFQQGLFEEEANHQLDAAIEKYKKALEKPITDRQIHANAVFRLAECYRKQGKTNESGSLYRRILTDFPDQTQFASLSSQYVGNSLKAPPSFVLAFGDSDPNGRNNLRFPGGIAVDDSGNVYVADTQNSRIQKFTARGQPLARWGTGGDGEGCFAYPQGLAIDAGRHLYVADRDNHRVQKFTLDGGFVAQWGRFGSKEGEFNRPYSIAIDSSGSIYVADARNHRIQKFTAEGTFVKSFGTAGTGTGQLDQPKSVAVDAKGTIYVCDTGNIRVEKFSAAGEALGGWGTSGKLPGQFHLPHDVAIDRWGNVYVADADGPSQNNRVQMFAADGTLHTLWGTLGDGPGQFNFAARVAVDRSGLNVYVCDASNNRVQLFSWSPQ